MQGRNRTMRFFTMCLVLLGLAVAVNAEEQIITVDLSAVAIVGLQSFATQQNIAFDVLLKVTVQNFLEKLPHPI